MNNNITAEAFALELEKAAAQILLRADWVRQAPETGHPLERVICHHAEYAIKAVVDGLSRIGGDASRAICEVVHTRMNFEERNDLLVDILEWEKEAQKLPRVEHTMREYPTMKWAGRHISEIK